MNGELEMVQKGLDYIQFVVVILKIVGKCINVLELFCNFFVSCFVCGDDRFVVVCLVFMRIFGFLDDEVFLVLYDVIGSNELGVYFCYNVGCQYYI